MQTILMTVIAILCFGSGVDWLFHGNIASGLAFIGFGLGYLGLAALFM